MRQRGIKPWCKERMEHTRVCLEPEQYAYLQALIDKNLIRNMSDGVRQALDYWRGK